MYRFLVLLLSVVSSTCFGQFVRPSGPVTGRFYIDVDDGARIFINGKLVYSAGIDTSISPEVSLPPGDRIVAQLFNTAGGKWFKLAFVATDQKSAISFQRANFKIISDLTVVDFTAADWAKWNRMAKSGTHKRERLPVKNTADEMRGDGENTSVGPLVQAEMFRPYVAPGGAQATAAAAAQELMLIEGFVDGPSTCTSGRTGFIGRTDRTRSPDCSRCRPT